MELMLLNMGFNARAYLEIGDGVWWECKSKKVAGVWVWMLWVGPYIGTDRPSRPWVPGFSKVDNLEITIEQVETCRIRSS